jgi:predicted lysophospholipase L1 biosynthesis ABC-type transport system permease subunit
VEGRTFEQRDHDQRLGTAIISASLKEAYWPGSSALDRRLLPAGGTANIVGVVGDVHDGSLTSPPEQILYLPMLDGAGGGVRAMNIAVRTASDPSSIMPLIRQEIARMDPLLPITDARMMSRIVGESMSRVTFTMSLLVLAALVSLVLGAVGIFGLVSYIVAQRTTEIGIRHALGATHWSVWGLVMRQAMVMATAGVLLGVIAAAGMGRSLASLVYGIEPFDWAVFVAGAVVFLLVAAAAASIPAYRAARVQPIRALRQE